MNVLSVCVCNFRNHKQSRLDFGPGINALLGMNGQGKTNILEAISYLSLTKSFYASGDATVLRIGDEGFDIEGHIVTDAGSENRVIVTYSRETGTKEFRINGVRPDNLASVIGRFPIVILSPENSSVTFGGPGDRRKFVDLILCQLSRTYLADLLEYRRVLKQRNKLIAGMRMEHRYRTEELAPWDAALVRHGSRIIARRMDFVHEFAGYVRAAYGDLVREKEEPLMEYVTLAAGLDGMGEGEVATAMAEVLEDRRTEEIRRGMSLVGPHRDEVRFQINGISVQQYASQGQHKTLLVALKVAEFFYLKERANELPIFLLDDLFSELDEQRSRHILELVGRLGQTIITATDERVFHNTVPWGTANRRFLVDNGTVRAS